MYNKVFKNNQVNIGVPFQVKGHINFNTIKKLDDIEQSSKTEANIEESVHLNKESYEDILNRANEEVDAILKEAHFEALRIIENTEKEASEAKIRIEEEAWNKGYEDGLNESKNQYEDMIQEAEFIKEHAKVEYKEVLEKIESDAVNVILDIAKSVIGIEISFNKEDILYLVKQAFEKCANKESIILKISTSDYEYVIKNKDRLLSMVEGIGEVEIKKDVSLKEGACIVETPYGNIDASVQTKLKKIEEAFRQAIGK